MILPRFAVNRIASATESPARTVVEENPNVVSPLAVAVASARRAPLTDRVAYAVTFGDGSIWTSAVSILANPAGTVNVCVTVPPGIDSGRPAFPRHIACPATAGP